MEDGSSVERLAALVQPHLDELHSAAKLEALRESPWFFRRLRRPGDDSAGSTTAA